MLKMCPIRAISVKSHQQTLTAEENPMSNIPASVKKRLIATVPKFRKVLQAAKERDINESDTAAIVTDMLAEIFGFDKYSEITREYAVQGTYCDLAVKTGKGIEYLLEVKAIGLELNEKHLKQAVNYAAREGVKWVILTNAIEWEIYRVTLDDKVNSERLVVLDLTEINPRIKDQQNMLFLLCKRGVKKDLISEFYEYKQSVNRHTIGALLLTDVVANLVRRELRKFKPGIKVDVDEIKSIIQHETIKREVLESRLAVEANKLAKFLKKRRRAKNQTTHRPEDTTGDGTHIMPS